jgi:hypothetical protein
MKLNRFHDAGKERAVSWVRIEDQCRLAQPGCQVAFRLKPQVDSQMDDLKRQTALGQQTACDDKQLATTKRKSGQRHPLAAMRCEPKPSSGL